MACHWDSPATSCNFSMQGIPRGFLGNDHIQRLVQYAVWVTYITVGIHKSYLCSQLLPLPGDVETYGLTRMEHLLCYLYLLGIL